MGGFFAPPSPPPPTVPAPGPDPAEEVRKRRLEAIDRRRRGRAGTVATSERGVLDTSTPSATDSLKTKLGE